MLLDTSGLYCYLDAGDARHTDAVYLLESAKVRFTHNYVLAELVALCNARGLDRGVTLGFISALTDDPEIRMVWLDKRNIGRPSNSYGRAKIRSILCAMQ